MEIMKIIESFAITLIGINIIGCLFIFFKMRQLKLYNLKYNILQDKYFFFKNELLINGIFVIEFSYLFASYNWIHQNIYTRSVGLTQDILCIYTLSECFKSLFR